MKLSNAAAYFDRLPVYDAYTGALLFKAQLDLYDDSRRDALNVLRRILSVAPGTTLPARRAITAGNHMWLLGEANEDTFNDGPIRSKLILQRVHGMCSIRTPGQVIAGAGGQTAYAGLAWLKDWKEAEYGSRVYPYYEAFFSTSETVEPGHYLVFSTQVLRVRSVYESEAGFLAAEVDDLGAAIQTVTLVAAPGYNPATDVLTTSSATRTALVMRFTANFEYLQESAPKREEGDLIVLLSKAQQTSVPTNSSVVIGTRVYSIMSRVDENDAWRLHVRP